MFSSGAPEFCKTYWYEKPQIAQITKFRKLMKGRVALQRYNLCDLWLVV